MPARLTIGQIFLNPAVAMWLEPSEYWMICQLMNINAPPPARAILILTFFRNPYFAFSQVLPLGSLVSKLFLFLLYDLSFPCGYFFLASMGISLGK